MSYRALMIIASIGFRDEEYFEPKKIFEENNIEVTTASEQSGTAVGKLSARTDVNITLNEVDISKYNIIIYVGGPGCKQFWYDTTAHSIAKEAVINRKILGAICSAPVILSKAGLLKGINATCFPGDADILKEDGANYTGSPVEQSGLIVTADGPLSAQAFAVKIVQLTHQIG